MPCLRPRIRRQKARLFGLNFWFPFFGSKDGDLNMEIPTTSGGAMWVQNSSKLLDGERRVAPSPVPPLPLGKNFRTTAYPCSPFYNVPSAAYVRNAQSLDIPLSSPGLSSGSTGSGTPMRSGKAPDLGVVQEGSNIIGCRPSELKSAKRHSMSSRLFLNVFRKSKERSRTPQQSSATEFEAGYAMSSGRESDRSRDRRFSLPGFPYNGGNDAVGTEGPRCPPDNVFIPSGDFDQCQSLDSPMTYMPSPVADSFGRSTSRSSVYGGCSLDSSMMASPCLQLWDTAEFSAFTPRANSPCSQLVPGWQGYDPRMLDVGTGVRTEFSAQRNTASDGSNCDADEFAGPSHMPRRRTAFEGARPEVIGRRGSAARLGFRGPDQLPQSHSPTMMGRRSASLLGRSNAAATRSFEMADNSNTRCRKPRRESMAKNIFGFASPTKAPSASGTQTPVDCFQDISGTTTPIDRRSLELCSRQGMSLETNDALLEHPVNIENSLSDSLELAKPQALEMEIVTEVDSLKNDTVTDSVADRRPSSSLKDVFSDMTTHAEKRNIHISTRRKSLTRKRYGSMVESLAGWQEPRGSRDLDYDEFVAQGEDAVGRTVAPHIEKTVSGANQRASLSLSDTQIAKRPSGKRPPMDKSDSTLRLTPSKDDTASLRSIELAASYTSDGPLHHRSMCFDTVFSSPEPSVKDEGRPLTSCRVSKTPGHSPDHRRWHSDSLDWEGLAQLQDGMSDFVLELDCLDRAPSRCTGSFRPRSMHDDGIPDYPTEPAFSEETCSVEEGEEEYEDAADEEEGDVDDEGIGEEMESERELVRSKTRKTWMDELQERAELRRKECTYRIACQRAIMHRMKEQVQASKLAFDRIKEGLCPELTEKVARLRRRWGGTQRAHRRERLARVRELEAEELWDSIPLPVCGCGLALGPAVGPALVDVAA